MDQIILKLFDTDHVDINLVKLIREFAGDRSTDVDCFVQNIMKRSTGHDELFGVEFRFKLGLHNVKLTSKFENNLITLELRSRGFHKLLCRMPCARDQIASFDEWIAKTQEYFEMCESMLYFIIHQYKDGLLKCDSCGKFHWCHCLHTCRNCLQTYNNNPCPICKSHFGTQPHRHSTRPKDSPSSGPKPLRGIR